ncbi:MAG: phage holin family protein [Gordonibacter sp.]|uniref:phage holin family protein n=1 Tax=Gordonibacter sp. TaxID=1968902 RepID=UPI002FCCB7BF
MDIGFVTEYISPIALVICLCVGYVIKNIVPDNRVNRYIPLVVGVLGVVIVAWGEGWAFTPQTVALGLVSGLGSTGLYEAFRNIIGVKGA